ncbi:MAG: UvrD-helicase domain-containing protein, partial [Gammaproteobacteria bacterium]|nr:UvrD-helicase domain-containing protein [Gammaproteobacteria bacterium]
AFAFQDCIELPPVTAEYASFWQALADCVLTQKNDLRKKLDRQCGFPISAADAESVGIPVADLKSRKARFTELLEELGAHERFVNLLAETRTLPATAYADQQWKVIEALLLVLRLAVAQLHEVIAENGLVDFSEISMRATLALGSADAPTDLALVLDYRLRHILVDEFQDTSLSQFELFEKLVAGWEPGDGRTFFAVGDPMQSIYRFRNAEVGLFLHAQQRGIGDIPLESLQLEVNFRSRPEIVNWCNAVFADLFPDIPDSRAGAITYSRSVPFRESDGTAGSRLHVFLERDWLAQAELVADVVEQSLAERSGEVAILVRSKSTLAEIFPALQLRGIPYQAIDIETLGDRLIVKDLQSLAAAMQHPQDRLHWLAVLRAPWCGLSLADMHLLAATDAGTAESPPETDTAQVDGLQADLFGTTENSQSNKPADKQSIWSRLNDPDVLQTLSADGQARVQRLIGILTPALDHSGRAPLVPWLESCWLQLGGPAGATATDRLAAEACLRELAVIESAGLLWDGRYVATRLQTLFAPPAQGEDVRVQIMTIHKSKGLEFETVLLPSLGRQAGQDMNQLLNWFEFKNADGDPRLLLAPVPEANLDSRFSDPLLKLVRKQQQIKADNELLRLLYVAATRTRTELHLFADTSIRDSELVKPLKNTLLSPLWDIVKPDFESAYEEVKEAEAALPQSDTAAVESQGAESTPPSPIFRLDADAPVMKLQERWLGFTATSTDASTAETVEFDWAGLDARYVGTVVHRQLQRIADESLGQWTSSRINSELDLYRLQLLQQGVPEPRLEKALQRLVRALHNVIEDSRAQWLLGPRQEARSEYRLTGYVDDRLVNKIIDRTFVDQGVRWIVDYKTGDHRGGKVQEFLDREQQRYFQQLEDYVVIMRQIDQRPIRLGLYFPLIQGFREWEPGQLTPDSA